MEISLLDNFSDENTAEHIVVKLNGSEIIYRNLALKHEDTEGRDKLIEFNLYAILPFLYF